MRSGAAPGRSRIAGLGLDQRTTTPDGTELHFDSGDPDSSSHMPSSPSYHIFMIRSYAKHTEDAAVHQTYTQPD